MRLRSLWVVLIVAFVALGATLVERQARAGSDVDMLLVIALDVSASVDAGEYDLQREGFARALSSPEVMAAISDGIHKSIAVNVVQWSGFIEHKVEIDWIKVSSAGDLSRLADQVRRMARRYNGGATDIGAAITFCQRLFASAPYSSVRWVINIAGDGTNNVNYSPRFERDRVVAIGTKINGLAVAETTKLADYFRENVIGGVGSFVEMASDYSGFEHAMRRKLAREIGEKFLF